jgi:hypothetical protein
VANEHAQDDRILLGLGEEAEVRLPTLEEQFTYAVGEKEAVMVVHHADRGDEVMPACGRRVAARTYGVKLSVEGEGEL